MTIMGAEGGMKDCRKCAGDCRKCAGDGVEM